MFKTIATIAFLVLLGSAAPQAQQAPLQPSPVKRTHPAKGRRSRHQSGNDLRHRRNRAGLQGRPPFPSGRRHGAGHRGRILVRTGRPAARRSSRPARPAPFRTAPSTTKARPTRASSSSPSTWSRRASRWPRPRSSARSAFGRHADAAFSRAAQSLRRPGLRLPAELLLRGGDRAAAHRGRADPQGRPPGGLAREDRRAAHRLRRAHLQRGVPPAGAAIRGWSGRCSSISARTSTSTSSSSTPRPRSRATSGNGTRTTAPGRATTACRKPRAMNIAVFLDEVMPINGAAAAHSRQPQAGRVRGRPRQAHHVLSAVDARQGHRDAALPRGRGRARQPASSRRPASPARC